MTCRGLNDAHASLMLHPGAMVGGLQAGGASVTTMAEPDIHAASPDYRAAERRLGGALRATGLPTGCQIPRRGLGRGSGRGGRADEGGGLENRCGATHRGFESHSLRQSRPYRAAKPTPGDWRPHLHSIGDNLVTLGSESLGGRSLSAEP